MKIVTRMKRFGLLALMLGVLSLGISACGGDNATATTAPQPAATNTTGTGGSTGGTGTAQEIAITLKEWAIEPANIEANAGKVKITVTNAGEFAHDIAFQGLGDAAKIPPFKASDGPKTLELDVTPGTYTMICDVPGHADHGMKGTFTVK